MKSINTFTLLLILFSLNSFSQKKIELIEYTSSECNEIYFSNLNKINTRILDIESLDGISSINIFTKTNCDNTEVGEIEIKNDTLNLIHHIKGYYLEPVTRTIVKNDSIQIIEEITYIEEITECDCAYKLNYKIKNIDLENFIITLNGKRIEKSEHKFKIVRKQPTFSIIDNDTINIVDIYGLKQGLHIINIEDGKQYSRIEYVDDEKVSGLTNTYYDFKGFEKVETFMENKKYTIRKYYNNRQLIKVCDTYGDFEDGTNCIFYNDK